MLTDCPGAYSSGSVVATRKVAMSKRRNSWAITVASQKAGRTPASSAAGLPGTASHTGGTAGARRIAETFAVARAEGRAALIPYVVAGYPDADTSLAIATAIIDAGADVLEVGLPYSDPLADGATLQRASQVALAFDDAIRPK